MLDLNQCVCLNPRQFVNGKKQVKYRANISKENLVFPKDELIILNLKTKRQKKSSHLNKT